MIRRHRPLRATARGYGARARVSRPAFSPVRRQPLGASARRVGFGSSFGAKSSPRRALRPRHLGLRSHWGPSPYRGRRYGWGGGGIGFPRHRPRPGVRVLGGGWLGAWPELTVILQRMGLDTPEWRERFAAADEPLRRFVRHYAQRPGFAQVVKHYVRPGGAGKTARLLVRWANRRARYPDAAARLRFRVVRELGPTGTGVRRVQAFDGERRRRYAFLAWPRLELPVLYARLRDDVRRLKPGASLRYVLPRGSSDDPALRTRLRRLERRVGGRVRFVRFPCQRA
jgi:hypothetical protein